MYNTHTHTYIHTYTHTHIHTSISHTHTHTHTHTCIGHTDKIFEARFNPVDDVLVTCGVGHVHFWSLLGDNQLKSKKAVYGQVSLPPSLSLSSFLPLSFPPSLSPSLSLSLSR